MPSGGLIAAAVAAPVVGGIMGSISASSGRKAAAAAAAAALAELNKIGLPPDLSKQIILEKFQSQGVLTPELEQDINLQASQVAQIKEDPSLRANQMDVLSTLGQVSRGGLRAEDRAAYNELRQATQRDSEAKRQQILQQMQARGMGGSGNELMTQLQSAQAAEDAQSAGADRLAAQASQNALAALAQRAQQAGSMRGQDFNVNQARALAEDDRNKFLFQNSVARQRANVSAQNEAQRANLSNAQRLSDENASQSNRESLRQVQAKRDYYQDQMSLATAKANALNNQATVAQNNANSQANMWSGLGNSVGQGFAAYGNYAAKKPATPTERLSAEQIAGREAEDTYKF